MSEELMISAGSTTFEDALVSLSCTIRNWLDKNAFYTKNPGNVQNIYELISTGVYYIPNSSTSTFTDRPSDFLGDGVLIVNADGDNQIQILINYTNLMVYFRTKATNENSFISKPWEKVSSSTTGEGVNSLISGFQTIARSESSVALGYQTEAGAKAFEFDIENYPYTEYEAPDENGYGIYHLTNVDGIQQAIDNYKAVEERDQQLIAAGQQGLTDREKDNYKVYYTIVLGGNYDYRGEILEVNEFDKTIKVTNYIQPKGDGGNHRLEAGHSYLFLPNYLNYGTKIIGTGGVAVGYGTRANSIGAHAEGYATIAAGKYSHAEGKMTKAGYAAHAEGRETEALGENAHSEGVWTRALGNYSHAEGKDTDALGGCSHSEGYLTSAEGYCSHVEGKATKATGAYSHAEGTTVANGEYQHTQGKYNIPDNDNKYAHIVGNGADSAENTSNAHTVDWKGNAWYAGDVYTGGSYAYDIGSGVVTDAKKMATEEFVEKQYKYLEILPGDASGDVLINFNTTNKTITIDKLIVVSDNTPNGYKTIDPVELSYVSNGYTPSIVVINTDPQNGESFYESLTRAQYIDKLKTEKDYFNKYRPLFAFNPGRIDNPENISYRGPFSVNGTVYNNPKSQKDTGDIVKYVNSNIGSDLNTGDNAATAYQTIMKAVNAGATIIRVAPGTYPEYVNIVSKKKIQIICNFGSTDSKRNKVIISDAILCAFSATNISTLYSFSFEDANMKQAFNNDINNINAYTSYNFNNASSGRSSGYIFNLWRKQDNKKIIPIKYQASYATDGLPSDDLYWTYDTENNLIYTNAGVGEYNLSLSVSINDLSFSTTTDAGGNSVIDTNTIVLKTEKSPRTGINLKYIQNVVLEDIVVDYAQFQGISISGCNNVNVNNCEAKYSSLSNGFAILDTNGIFNNCNGSYNRNDGINITSCGNTIFNDCRCENNGDDGISHHAACTGTINGGYFTGNGKGGVSPAHGAMVNCINAISIKNKQYGFYVVDSRKDTTDYGRRITLNNCYAKENDIADIIVTNYNVNAFTCNFGQIADFIETDITSLTQYS